MSQDIPTTSWGKRRERSGESAVLKVCVGWWERAAVRRESPVWGPPIGGQILKARRSAWRASRKVAANRVRLYGQANQLGVLGDPDRHRDAKEPESNHWVAGLEGP